jgi:hypothetical protein
LAALVFLTEAAASDKVLPGLNLTTFLAGIVMVTPVAGYNGYRVHAALDGEPPLSLSGNDVLSKANINEYRWKSHCRDLFQTPMAA